MVRRHLNWCPGPLWPHGQRISDVARFLRFRNAASQEVQPPFGGFHSHGDIPNSWMVCFMENPMNRDDLGVDLWLRAPPFQELMNWRAYDSGTMGFEANMAWKMVQYLNLGSWHSHWKFLTIVCMDKTDHASFFSSDLGHVCFETQSCWVFLPVPGKLVASTRSSPRPFAKISASAKAEQNFCHEMMGVWVCRARCCRFCR